MCTADVNFQKSAREYRAEKQGYWTGEKFMENIKDAVRIAKFKHANNKHTVVFIFDQSSCHRAFSEDALNSVRMNVMPGGKQPAMHDTEWGGERCKKWWILKVFLRE